MSCPLWSTGVFALLPGAILGLALLQAPVAIGAPDSSHQREITPRFGHRYLQKLHIERYFAVSNNLRRITQALPSLSAPTPPRRQFTLYNDIATPRLHPFLV